MVTNRIGISPLRGRHSRYPRSSGPVGSSHTPPWIRGHIPCRAHDRTCRRWQLHLVGAFPSSLQSFRIDQIRAAVPQESISDIKTKLRYQREGATQPLFWFFEISLDCSPTLWQNCKIFRKLDKLVVRVLVLFYLDLRWIRMHSILTPTITKVVNIICTENLHSNNLDRI